MEPNWSVRIWDMYIDADYALFKKQLAAVGQDGIKTLLGDRWQMAWFVETQQWN